MMRPSPETSSTSPALWLWSDAEARVALASGDLGRILFTYRKLNKMTQEQLAELLGYDKTYVSMLENHRRTITDVLRRQTIAHTLGIPAHVLGVADGSDTEFAVMMEFGASVVRLAELARQTGRAVDAVNELWPLVARLESRASEGRLDGDAIRLLAQARLTLGVSLGTVLPEERLCVAAGWTGKALVVARQLEDRALLFRALAMHGNELRKTRHLSAAESRLNHAIMLAAQPAERGTALAFLARTVGERGKAEQFDQAISDYRRELEFASNEGMLLNSFAFHEVRLRGLMTTGRAADAAALAVDHRPDEVPVAPQWKVIEKITVGKALLAAGDRNSADTVLAEAVRAAECSHLAHQVQRVTRIAKRNQLTELGSIAQAALQHVQHGLVMSARPGRGQTRTRRTR